MMPCNNYYMVYTYSFMTFYVEREYVRLSGQSKCWKLQNKVIVMPTAHSLRKYSSIHNMYVYLLQHCIIDFFSHRCSIFPAI